jgi:hypothetical protein
MNETETEVVIRELSNVIGTLVTSINTLEERIDKIEKQMQIILDEFEGEFFIRCYNCDLYVRKSDLSWFGDCEICRRKAELEREEKQSVPRSSNRDPRSLDEIKREKEAIKRFKIK